MHRIRGRRAKALGAVFVLPLGLILIRGTAASAQSGGPHNPASSTYTAHIILSGPTLSHTFTAEGSTTPTTDPLTDPDDIALLDNDIFVGFQNGVGPQGQASSDGNLDSTVVELKLNGDPVAQWDVQGKTDGVTADPQMGDVIATVNEDANSSLYTIDPTAPPGSQVAHYNYNEPLPHFGGTDAISIDRGQILISASAPGTTAPAGTTVPQPTYPAVYSASLDRSTLTATVTPLFYDTATANVANLDDNYGQPTTLALTDPDSNEVVPPGARFGGRFMLTSQGDQAQIYVGDAGAPAKAWPSCRYRSPSTTRPGLPLPAGRSTPRIRRTTPLTPSGDRSSPSGPWSPPPRAMRTVLPRRAPRLITRPTIWPRSTRGPAR